MTNQDRHWQMIDDETKEKVVTSYMGIQNPVIRKSIENLYGYDNLNSYNIKKEYDNSTKTR